MTDLGLLAATSTAMLTRVSAGDHAGARAVSQVNYGTLYVLVTVAMSVMIPIALLSDPATSLPAETARVIFLLYALYAVLGLVTASFEGLIRAGGRHPLGWTLTSILRVADFVSVAIALLVTQDLAIAVLAMVVSRVIGVTILGAVARRVAWWASGVPSRWNRDLYRELALPSLASLTQPVATAFALQGTVLVVGGWLGPTAVVTLTTVRTLVNSIRQADMIFYNSSLPPLTQAFAKRDYERARIVFRRTASMMGLVGLVAAVGLLIAGRTFIELWTKGEIVVPLATLAAFIGAAAADVCWLVASMPDIARNRHFVVTATYASSVAMAVLVMAVIGVSSVEQVAMYLIVACLPALAVGIYRRTRHDFRD